MNNLKTMSTNTFRYKPINGFLEEYFNKTHVDYNYNLAGNSISAIVYKVDEETSTVSDGSATVLELIGPNSPYRYNRIDNVPIFNCQQVDITLEWTEEKGYATEMRLECVSNPSVVNIEVNDYICLDYSSYKNLFRVVNSSPDSFEQIYYNRLTLAPTQYTNENIDYQVSKRFSYIFETASILDTNTNNILNDILDQSNNLYKVFLDKYYLEHGILIDPCEASKLDKFFNFEDISSDAKLFSYFFKKYISNVLISVMVDSNQSLSKYIKEPCDKMFQYEESKFLYDFIKELQLDNNIDVAFNNVLKNKDNSFSFIEEYKDFYDLYQKTIKIVINTSLLVDINYKNNALFLTNLKKMIKIITKNNTFHSFLMYLLFFFLIRSISFKDISFNKRALLYGV